MNSLLLGTARRNIRRAFTLHNFSGRARSLHHPSPLAFDPDNGLGDFLSPQGARMLAIDYQHGLLQRVNQLVEGTEFENLSLFQTVASSALNRDHALLFNYACQALNNAFFLNILRPPPFKPDPHVQGIMGTFMTELVQTFGSKEHLQSSMSAAVMGMSGSGWVWLVVDQKSRLGIVATYGAGTLLVRSRRQHSPLAEGGIISTRQSTDQPPVTPKISAFGSDSKMRAPPPLLSRDAIRSIWNKAGGSDRTLDESLGEVLNPLLCISVHEHAWIGSGYGVWGKEEYLRRFWTVVDWEQVASHFGHWRAVDAANLSRPR